MGFKDSTNCAVLTLLCFTLLCSVAPAKQAQDNKVMSWLKGWTERLGTSAVNAFGKYEHVHFSHRPNKMPSFYLGILRVNFTALERKSPENITEAICRQLTEFTSPVYLALFDESQRLNSDPDLTKLLLNVSVALNSTLEMARYLHFRKFPDAKQTQVVKYWSRSKLHSHVQTYKTLSSDQAGINQLRSWATLHEVRDLASLLFNLYTKI